MKAKFLLVFLFAILFQVNIPSSAREMKSLRRIELSCKTQAQHRSIPITPVAFIEDALVTIDLLSTVPTATVVFANLERPLSIPSAAELQFLSCCLNIRVCLPAADSFGVNLSVKFNIVFIVLPKFTTSNQQT